jgi:cardiolipin synthase A/B
MTWMATVGWFFAAYALLTGGYIVLENRRPQATLAWMLLFVILPGVGLFIYLLFGRDRKAFSRERTLARQNLQEHAGGQVRGLRETQDRLFANLETQSPVRKRLMSLVRNNSHSALTAGNRVQIQQNAPTHYDSLMMDLRGAHSSIHLQYYSWADDSFTRHVKEVLVEKAQAGVDVRLLYDPVGSFLQLSRRYKRDLTRGGVHVAPVSPLYRLHTISYRNHRKIAVIDGRLAYMGGMNMGKEHLDGGPYAPSWRDTQIRIDGPGAAVLQTVFMVDWYNATGKDVVSEVYFPDRPGGCQPGAAPADPEEDRPEVPIQILTSGPDSQWHAIRQLYFNMIVSAQQRVRIQSPYFILDPTISEALKSAALSGVEVEVMISEFGDGLNYAPYWAANTYMAEVAASGARVYLYQKGYLHAKTVGIDCEVCSIGSANLDIRSFSINYEVDAVIYDGVLARRLDDAFEQDLKECRVFDPVEYAGRSKLMRLRDSTARLFSPLM